MTSFSDAEPNPAEETTTDERPLGVRKLFPRVVHHPATTPSSWVVHASSLGFARVGVARVDAETLALEAAAKTFTERWVDQCLNGPLTYMRSPRRSPPDLLPGAKSVIVVLAPTEVAAPADATSRLGHVAAYAQGLDYHHVLKTKLWELAQTLTDELATPINARVCVDTAPILERFWAERAGVTFTGKSTMAIAPGVGTTVMLALLLVDVTLPINLPLPQGCGECTLCLDACPTEAFLGPFVLDAARCISSLTIENPADIPVEHREALGNRVFGCDECQAVCPYNASKKRPGPLAELAALPHARAVDLHSWITLTSGDYKRLTKGSALRRAPRAQLQRNAVVALANSTELDAQDELVLQHAAAQNPSPLVRKHAAWALVRLDPTRAASVLRQLCETEVDATVLDELRRLLAEITQRAEATHDA